MFVYDDALLEFEFGHAVQIDVNVNFSVYQQIVPKIPGLVLVLK